MIKTIARLLALSLGLFCQETTIIAHGENNNKFILITGLYNESEKERIREYITCMEHNLRHPSIEKVHVIYDTTGDDDKNVILSYLRNKMEENKKLDVVYTHGRQTYGQCFEVANTLYPNRKIILSNSDIYFNETLELLNNYELTDKFLALTRCNVKEDGSIELFKQYDYQGKFSRYASLRSQDVWIFKTPLRKFENDTIQIGVMMCDCVIAYQAMKAGLIVLNPCITIRCCHLHLSEIRNYDIENQLPVPKDYKPAPWSRLEDALESEVKYRYIL